MATWKHRKRAEGADHVSSGDPKRAKKDERTISRGIRISEKLSDLSSEAFKRLQAAWQ